MNKFSFARDTAIVAILLAAFTVNVITTCPLACICKWKGGKRKVECVNKNLTSLLTEIESETQVLDYSQNQLRHLTEKMFENANLMNLQKLYVSECQITHIHDNAFQGLSNLIELDLTSNLLRTLPVETFRDTPLLMKLTAAQNPIQVIKANSFTPLKYLTSVDLSDCQIKSIEKDGFTGLQKLEWLKLDRNKLENVKYPETIPRVTGGISLHRNPWKCDCYLRHFHSWLLNSNKPIMVNPVCEEPSMYRGTPIDQLKMDDLACAPDVTPSSLYMETNEGKNLSFICRVNATPEAVITWEFEGYPISNNSSMVRPFNIYYVEEATTEQVSELFISEAKKENDGTYRCTAQNIAGKLTSNYTLKVISIEKEVPEPVTVSYFYILVSSASTLLVIVIVSLVITCLVLFSRSRRRRRKREAKPSIEYTIVKQSMCEATPSKSDKNPDLIINTEGTFKESENNEHMLLLPSDVKQTYLTLTGNTLLNATLYDGNALCAETSESQIDIPADYSATISNAGMIKLYFSPDSARKLHNLYVNPFEGYVDTIEQNCWALQLPESEKVPTSGDATVGVGVGVGGQIVIECCNEKVCNRSISSNTDDYINLRHNLEGYPYPSKLKLASLNLNQVEDEELDNAPILSPPDPFKTDIGTTIGPESGD